MAESPLDRLKRLAAEKKLAAAQPVVSAVAETASGEAGASIGLEETKIAILSMHLSMVDKQVKEEINNGNNEHVGRIGEGSKQVEETTGSGEACSQDSGEITTQGDRQLAPLSSSVEGLGDSGVSGDSNTTSNHPLAMQFAELESALLATDPEFKTILRQIHRHLGQEPELVTQMTEQEIQMVVQGLVVFANAEIVAPAAAKSEKAKLTAAKKKVISADDL